MVELSIYEVRISYLPNISHKFIQTFIGEPTAEDVIEFVNGLRKDTYSYVIDLMINQGCLLNLYL